MLNLQLNNVKPEPVAEPEQELTAEQVELQYQTMMREFERERYFNQRGIEQKAIAVENLSSLHKTISEHGFTDVIDSLFGDNLRELGLDTSMGKEEILNGLDEVLNKVQTGEGEVSEEGTITFSIGAAIAIALATGITIWLKKIAIDEDVFHKVSGKFLNADKETLQKALENKKIDGMRAEDLFKVKPASKSLIKKLTNVLIKRPDKIDFKQFVSDLDKLGVYLNPNKLFMREAVDWEETFFVKGTPSSLGWTLDKIEKGIGLIKDSYSMEDELARTAQSLEEITKQNKSKKSMASEESKKASNLLKEIAVYVFDVEFESNIAFTKMLKKLT